MKILQVITLFDSIYGAQKHVLDLSVGLKERGNEVIIVTGKKGIIAKQADLVNIEVIELSRFRRELNPIYDFLLIVKFIRLLYNIKPDYVHSHSSKAGIIARIACYLVRVPNSFTAHGWSFESGIPFLRRNIYRIIETLIGFISHKVIAVSEFGKEFALNLRVINASKLVTIPYGVFDYGFENFIEKPENDKLKLIMVAGFREQKDHETLFKSLELVKDKDWEISFVGDGPYLDYFQSKSEEIGIANKCKFIGAITDVTNYYINSDVKVLSTNWEGLPISILEAISFGLPVIATDVGGIKEEVIDQINGILVKPKSHIELKNAILYFIENKSSIKKMGGNSRVLYEQKYLLDIMVNKIEKHYLDSIA